ncbi:PTPRT [Mytilus coruscus]|uniref:protein-tyrosine-phosphatase n=1 Tax=Mytilus coruscus TaxID=42192 RepID=A0A6J8B2L8_MYTCO|nr:PTPRT [Mytilus coruscus]
MDGFKLYISNTSTIPPSGDDLCYKDPDKGLPKIIQTISCYQLGQYVVYYDDMAGSGDRGSIIELCYVAINGCKKTFWGSNCTKSCTERCIDQHCYPGNGSCVLGCNTKNCLNDLCDNSTAVCTNGCIERRTGTYCNKYSVATDASVSQIPSGSQPANLANDGDKTSCSKTHGTNIRFQVDMTEKRIVTEMYLTGKVNTTIKGLVHTIYASNSSREPEKGTVLYHGASLPQNISTNAVFRFLTFVPDTKSAVIELEICEIGIVGCPSTQYGPLCNTTCPTNCRGPCDLETGHCIFGCLNGWIGEKCEQVKSELEEELNGAVLSGSIGAVIAVILIMIAGCFIYKRNSKSTKDKYSDKSKSIRKTTFERKRETNDGNERVNSKITLDPGEVTVYLKDTKETELQFEGDDTVYNNVPTEQFAYKIQIGNLKEVINEKLKDDGFKKEYEILPKGLVLAHAEGSKEENKVKNRFLTTWPYDHSRIVLKGNTRTDYINASYIDNYDKEKAYIASQGPKSNTVRDFWHMIWQENAGKIVMVTQLKEGRRDKCAQYWPDAVNEPMVVDNYRLTMTKEKEHTLYVHRLITISNNIDTNQKERKVHQYHFIQWPDHGVPDSIKLVHFYRKVKHEYCDQNGPIVVHCSAGVGRTGTFIAIDALYEHGKKVGYVDIMEYVQMMRKDRMNMIQTYEQYETVFEALLELFTVPETTIPKNRFCKYIEDQECKTLPKNQKVYKREFQGYREESRFYVTQCPIKDTVVDFWTMVYDHNSTIIVLLDQVYKNAKLWLGRSEMLAIGDFSILLEEEHTVDELKIALDYKKQQEKRTINVFTTSDWQGATLPSTKMMVDLLTSVVNCWNSQKSPITVVCRDGCTKSGLFVAICLILDKMKIDEEVDVFQVVRNIQTRRPEFFKNCDQYEYCYKCIKELLEGESLYANT